MENLMLEVKIPGTYIQPKEYRICSNTFIDCIAPIVIKDLPLFLISAPDGQPSLWIFNGPERNMTKPLSFGEAQRTHFKIYTSEYETKVTFRSEMIMTFSVKKDSTVLVDFMNFKPLGINISGDPMHIDIGGNRYSDSVITNSKYGIVIG